MLQKDVNRQNFDIAFLSLEQVQRNMKRVDFIDDFDLFYQIIITMYNYEVGYMSKGNLSVTVANDTDIKTENTCKQFNEILFSNYIQMKENEEVTYFSLKQLPL